MCMAISGKGVGARTKSEDGRGDEKRSWRRMSKHGGMRNKDERVLRAKEAGGEMKSKDGGGE